MSFLSKITRWLQKQNAVMLIYRSLFNTYEKHWDFHARSRQSTISHILSGVKSEEEFDRKGRDFANFLKKMIRPGSVVLDLGCGIGRVSQFLVPHCTEVHGVDVSGRNIRLAREKCRGIKGLFFHKNNGRDIKLFADNTFDFAFATLMLQHLEKEDALSYLLEIHRVLKPGSSVYLDFLNILNTWNLKMFINHSKRYKYESVAKLRYYTKNEVRALLNAIGFKVLEITVDIYIRVLAEAVKPG